MQLAPNDVSTGSDSLELLARRVMSEGLSYAGACNGVISTVKNAVST
jgi:hypothetical protein